MKYCTQCGKQLTDDDNFCTVCGTAAKMIFDSNKMESEKKNENSSSRMPRKKRLKHVMVGCLVISILLCTIISVCFVLMNSEQKADKSEKEKNRTNFIIKYTSGDIEKFLKIVCRNIDGDYGKVIDPDANTPAGNSCYVAEMEVKLEGKVEELVQMRFYNDGDSDSVSYGKIFIHQYDSENEFNCYKEFILALEKTLSGTTQADQYITNRSHIENTALVLERFEPKTIASYWLTEELYVEIQCEHSFSWDWNMCYIIRLMD